MKERPNYWASCWKCNGKIKTQADCEYLHTRLAKLNFCKICFDKAICAANEYIQKERIEDDELRLKFRRFAIVFHETEHESELMIYECVECIAMLKTIPDVLEKDWKVNN